MPFLLGSRENYATPSVRDMPCFQQNAADSSVSSEFAVNFYDLILGATKKLRKCSRNIWKCLLASVETILAFLIFLSIFEVLPHNQIRNNPPESDGYIFFVRFMTILIQTQSIPKLTLIDDATMRQKIRTLTKLMFILNYYP